MTTIRHVGFRKYEKQVRNQLGTPGVGEEL